MASPLLHHLIFPLTVYGQCTHQIAELATGCTGGTDRGNKMRIVESISEGATWMGWKAEKRTGKLDK